MPGLSEVSKAFDRHPRVKGKTLRMYANGRSYSPDTFFVVDEGKTSILRRQNVTANHEPSPETIKRVAAQSQRDKSDVYLGVGAAKYSRKERIELARLAAGEKGKKAHRGSTAYVSPKPVKKDADDLQMPSWYQVGIPATRVFADPISPLAMSASSKIMLDSTAALLGRKLSRREKKAGGKKAYQLAGARGMLYSPLEMIG